MTILLRFYIKYVNYKFPKVPGVETNLVNQLIQNKQPDASKHFLLLDCREKQEIEISKIPGSQPVHFETDVSDLERFIRKEREKLGSNASLQLIIYCAIGLRSAILTEKALEVRCRIINVLKSYVSVLCSNLYNFSDFEEKRWFGFFCGAIELGRQYFQMGKWEQTSRW